MSLLFYILLSWLAVSVLTVVVWAFLRHTGRIRFEVHR